MPSPTTSARPVDATFRHVVFSPKGGIEGGLFDCDGAPAQVVLDKDDAASAAAFAALAPGASVRLVLEAVAEDGRPRAHAVHRLVRLVRDAGDAGDGGPAGGDTVRGTVARFNYARHGEPNGVVLDDGTFVHTKPDGLRGLGLAVGSTVEATGERRRLAHGDGWVVEARTVDGRAIGHGPGPAKKAAKKAAKSAAKKAAPAPAKKAATTAPGRTAGKATQ
jgi:hypothetical protein